MLKEFQMLRSVFRYENPTAKVFLHITVRSQNSGTDPSEKNQRSYYQLKDTGKGEKRIFNNYKNLRNQMLDGTYHEE